VRVCKPRQDPGLKNPLAQLRLFGTQPAWRALIDFYACPIVKGVIPDVGGMVMISSPTVFIDFMMACRVMDQVVEVPGGPNPIAMGCHTVIIGP
jgi:uncharacterized Zn-binding protein involved in type VI secretion